MSFKDRLQRFVLVALVGIGLVPLFYFVTVEVQIAGAASADDIDSTVDTKAWERFIENVAFGVGEKLTFDINYGFINAGTADMEVPRLIEYEGRPCYQIVTHAESNDFFSTFYKVEDRVESILDATGLYSWRFEKNLREGSYTADRMYSFDQENNLAYYDNDTIPVPTVVQDALSVLYYVRTQNLEVGKSLYVDNFTDGKQYPLEVKVLKKERVEVKAGTFDCIVVEPLTQSVGVFKHEGRLKVWLTDDRLRMPVLMKSKVLVGSISAELTDYTIGELVSF
ncbi:MAG TPA: DUF3108 domain-containing protein [candidate division Zixibacteria bacterium]|nr:DUF3108 domain-containing protein [candidate division Zixibacteria bacterium]